MNIYILCLCIFTCTTSPLQWYEYNMYNIIATTDKEIFNNNNINDAYFYIPTNVHILFLLNT